MIFWEAGRSSLLTPAVAAAAASDAVATSSTIEVAAVLLVCRLFLPWRRGKLTESRKRFDLVRV